MSRSVLCLLALCVFPYQPAAGQTLVTTGALRGRVSDQTGASVPGVQVRLLEESTRRTQGRKTDREGLFFFPALPVGGYSVEISANGFRTAEVHGLNVQLGAITSSDVQLHTGANRESVEVVAPTPSLRTTESTISTIMNRDLLEDVPLSGRRYLDFALLSPNASPDGPAGLVSFAGEQGGEDTGYANGNGANAFTLDGANATSNYFGNARGGERVPYVFGENAIQEFQVAVSPYSAAYGGGATGFLNTVTRSGSDTFHGNAFYFNRNSGTGANDAVDKANGIRRPLDVLQQFGAALGGPIVHKRAWFFFDYEQHREHNPISVINSDYEKVTQFDFGIPQNVLLPVPNG